MFEYEYNPPLDCGALAELFAQTGWQEADSGAKLEWMVAGSEDWITCRVDGELVGFGRTFRLDAVRRLVFDVVVDQRYEGWGVDEEIIRRLAGDMRGMQELSIFRHDVPDEWWSEGEDGGYWAPETPPDAYLG